MSNVINFKDPTKDKYLKFIPAFKALLENNQYDYITERQKLITEPEGRGIFDALDMATKEIYALFPITIEDNFWDNRITIFSTNDKEGIYPNYHFVVGLDNLMLSIEAFNFDGIMDREGYLAAKKQGIKESTRAIPKAIVAESALGSIVLQNFFRLAFINNGGVSINEDSISYNVGIPSGDHSKFLALTVIPRNEVVNE